jgi:hypothetical protein
LKAGRKTTEKRNQYRKGKLDNTKKKLEGSQALKMLGE